MATLRSVNVGLPKDVEWRGHTVHTGIWKHSVDGPAMVRRLNVDGDGQGDRAGHGGEQRAVFVYQLDSYRHWETHFRRDDFEYGQFGENFTVDGLADDEVCIGDRYRIGEAEFEVTQPRVTCFRVGMRLGEPQLAALLVAHHRPGFYLRVITEGRVTAGDEIVRTREGPHRLTVAEIDGLLYLPGRDEQRMRDAVDIGALSPGWVQSFRELLEPPGPTAGTAAAEPPAWPGFRRLTVERLATESTAVTSVYLSAPDGQTLPRPHAGQYLTLRFTGIGAQPAVRNYSISSAPDASSYRISVKREAFGVVSRYVHDGLRTGVEVEVGAPRGEFVLSDADGAVLLLSAGVGVTPVLAMLHELADTKSRRPVWWIHVARNAAEQPFAAEAHELLSRLPDAHEHVFYTSSDAAPASANPATLGRPTQAALAALGLPADTTAYVCGPTGFMTDMRQVLVGLGIPGDRVHVESFGTRPAINPGVTDIRAVRPHQPPGPPGTGAEVTFVRSGITAAWNGRDGSLLEFAESCDVPVRFSCRTGVCHTCETTVLDGRAAYDLPPLEAPPESSVLICCARPAGRIVLDL